MAVLRSGSEFELRDSNPEVIMISASEEEEGLSTIDTADT